MKLKTISKLNLEGKKILLRLDLNAALQKGKPLDEPRFEAHAKTVRELSKKGAKIVILAHQGRKRGKDFVPNLKNHARILEKYTKIKIEYIDDLFGSKATKKIDKLKNGEIVLLRNVRDYKDEADVKGKKNRYINFSKKFYIYINDAFSISHRDQGSITIPPKIIPGYAGPVLYKEFLALKKFREMGKKKMLFILGGEKIEDYFSLLKKLNNKESRLLAGGVLGNIILYEGGIKFGYEENWLRKKGKLKSISKVREIVKKNKNKIFLPKDFAIEKKGRKEILISDLPVSKKIRDIGSKSIKEFKEKIKNCEVLLMKGPLGFSEIAGFEKGTLEVLKEISKQTKKKKVYSLIGGGHLTTTIKKYKIKNDFSHVSLSGGALMKFICKEKLPGLEVLKK